MEPHVIHHMQIIPPVLRTARTHWQQGWRSAATMRSRTHGGTLISLASWLPAGTGETATATTTTTLPTQAESKVENMLE